MFTATAIRAIRKEDFIKFHKTTSEFFKTQFLAGELCC
jgi:hypothetical protein